MTPRNTTRLLGLIGLALFALGVRVVLEGVFMSLIRADARQLPIADGVVHCCVTSPPYFGLRDYGTATWDGGDPACPHAVRRWDGPKQTQGAMSAHAAKADRLDRRECMCGARRIDQQIGLEATPAAYIDTLVAVFREVWRVLADDGTCWVNLGDSYAGSGPSGASYQSETTKRRAGLAVDGAFRISKRLGPRGLSYAEKKPVAPVGWKSKDLLMMPARLALALQADGWYLRSDIIWAKPNPMPESVTDRPTKSHEHLFLLTKAERYYYDATAIAEPANLTGKGNARSFRGGGAYIQNRSFDNDATVARETHGNIVPTLPTERNKRDVWTVPTQAYADAHFATMPEALVEPCILAGCPLGGLVLDPFCGTFTVGAVAARLSRRAVGVDLSYQHLAAERTAQRGLMFAEAVS
jgi:DNA modification methylase